MERSAAPAHRASLDAPACVRGPIAHVGQLALRLPHRARPLAAGKLRCGDVGNLPRTQGTRALARGAPADGRPPGQSRRGPVLDPSDHPWDHAPHGASTWGSRRRPAARRVVDPGGRRGRSDRSRGPSKDRGGRSLPSIASPFGQPTAMRPSPPAIHPPEP